MKLQVQDVGMEEDKGSVRPLLQKCYHFAQPWYSMHHFKQHLCVLVYKLITYGLLKQLVWNVLL